MKNGEKSFFELLIFRYEGVLKVKQEKAIVVCSKGQDSRTYLIWKGVLKHV